MPPPLSAQREVEGNCHIVDRGRHPTPMPVLSARGLDERASAIALACRHLCILRGQSGGMIPAGVQTAWCETPVRSVKQRLLVPHT
jgi:hypothetical protein